MIEAMLMIVLAGSPHVRKPEYLSMPTMEICMRVQEQVVKNLKLAKFHDSDIFTSCVEVK